MKAKILFLCLLLASSLITHAQYDYATNVVGFTTVHMAADEQLLIANQFNTASNVLSQLISAPDNATFIKYDDDNGWFTFTSYGGSWNGDTTLNPGEGGFYSSPTAVDLVFCGEVLQGSLTNTLPIGLTVVRSDMVPLAGTISTVLGLPQEGSDNLFIYTNAENVAYTYDGVGLSWLPVEPTINLGQAFWYQKTNTSVNPLWIQTSSVTPYSSTGPVRLDIAKAGAGLFNLFLSGAPSQNTYYVMSKPTLNSAYWSYEATIVGSSASSILASGRDSAFFCAVSVMADSDADGIPDWWLLQYFGHATGQAYDHSRAQDDADGDGLTNLQEFIRGSNPHYSSSACLFLSTPKSLNLP